MTVKITGTVRVMQYCSAELDFDDEYCDMLPFYSIHHIDVDGTVVKTLPMTRMKAYREMMSGMDKPWVIRRGQLVENYTCEYEVDGDDVSKLQLVVSDDFKWLLCAVVSEYILYDGQKVESTTQNEEIIEGKYEEFLVKR